MKSTILWPRNVILHSSKSEMTKNWVVFVYPSFDYFSLYHGSHVSTASVETLLTLRFSKQLYSGHCTVFTVHTALVYRPQSSHVSSNHFISPAFIEQQMSSDHQTVQGPPDGQHKVSVVHL